MTILNFSSSRLDIADLLNLGRDDFSVNLFRQKITNPGNPDPLVVDNFIAAADVTFDFEFGLDLALGDTTLGQFDVDYPVEIDLVQPEIFTPGKSFELGVSDFVVEGATLDSTSLGFDDLGVDLFMQSGGLTLEDVSLLNTSFGSVLELGDFSFGSFDRFEVPIIRVLDAALDRKIFPGLNLRVGNPLGRDSTGTQDGTGLSGDLPNVEQPFRDRLIEVNGNLTQLASNIPNLQLLKLLEFEVLSKVPVVGDVLGIRAKVILAQLFAAIGFDLVQEFSFDAKDITASYTIEGKTFEGTFGEVSDIDTSGIADSALADGTLDGFVEFDLSGDFFTSVSIVPTGAIGLRALGLSFQIDQPSVSNFSAPVAPLVTRELRADGTGIEVVAPTSVPLPDTAFKPIKMAFSVPIVEAAPPELQNLPSEINARGGAQTRLDLSGVTLFDADTLDDILVTLRVSAGTLFAEDAGGVTVLGNGTGRLRLDGTEAEISAFFANRLVRFDPGETEDTIELSFRGNDREGFGNVAMGSVTINVVEAPEAPGQVEDGSGANDNLNPEDFDVAVAFSGGGGNDTLNGSNRDDLLDGGTGNDALNGLDGDDLLLGGPGFDLLIGGAGDDDLQGGDDGDELRDDGGANNTLDGGGGNDRLTLQDDATGQLFGGTGNDSLNGLTGDDDLFGGDGDDVLAPDGSFRFAIDRGDDFAAGGGGNDTITAGLGADTLLGEAGNDSIRGGGAGSEIEGGTGQDTLASSTGALFVDGGAGDDLVLAEDAIEALGGEGNDTLRINGPGVSTLDGGDGNDLIESDGGSLSSPSSGADVVFGGAGNDTINAQDGDLVDGGAGADSITAALSLGDTLKGGADADEIRGSVTTDEIDGGAGNDLISLNETAAFGAPAQRVKVLGGAGNDTVLGVEPSFAVAGLDIDGGAGNDQLSGSSGDDVIVDLSGNNQLFGGAAFTGDILRTGLGNDLIRAGAGNDTISSGDGDDTIDAGTGGDVIRAGAGDDSITLDTAVLGETAGRILAGDGDDTIKSAVFPVRPDATDLVNGGAGDDRFEALGLGRTVIGGTGLDRLATGQGLDPSVISVTIDLGRGVMFDTADPSRTSDLEGIEEVELTRRTVDGVDVATLEGRSADLDLALSLLAPDVVRTTSALDVVLGSGADETLVSGSTGSARLEGRGGNDLLQGLIAGEGGFGNVAGRLFLDGGAGIDTLIGGNGGDTLVADIEDALMDGRLGQDLGDFSQISRKGQLFVDLTQDDFQSASLDDIGMSVANIEDLIGRDRVADTLLGGTQTEFIDAQGGNDVIGLPTLDGSALVDGGAGRDTFVSGVDFNTTVRLIELANPRDFFGDAFEGAAFLTGFGVPRGAVELRNVENAVTGAGNDLLESGSGRNVLSSGAGDDTLRGGAGRDSLIGGAGDDRLFGDAGNDTMLGEAGNDTFTGGAGADRYVFAPGFGNDVIEDFDPARDRLEIGVGRARDIVVTPLGPDTRITVDGSSDSILLRGVSDPGRAVRPLILAEAADVNTAPLARDDLFEGGRFDVIRGNVIEDNGLGQDIDIDSPRLRIAAVNGATDAVGTVQALASGATVRVFADGRMRYDPNGAFDEVTVGRQEFDGFTYDVSDGQGGVDTAQVTVTLSGPAGATAPGGCSVWRGRQPTAERARRRRWHRWRHRR